MFPRRFFAAVFFAPRYFPVAQGTGPVTHSLYLATDASGRIFAATT
jgi:hypothetical protein